MLTQIPFNPYDRSEAYTGVYKIIRLAFIVQYNLYNVSKKQAKLFLLLLRQTSTKSDNFWQKDGKLSRII